MMTPEHKKEWFDACNKANSPLNNPVGSVVAELLSALLI